jgi:predicted DNA-binding transcriptional regulator YafY
MRADRLLSLTLLLRHRGRMTASALATELEVSERTVLRDVEALSTAGIPVYAERGRHGGIALLPGFSTDLTGLTTDEAVALLTTPRDVLGRGQAFSSAIRKLVAALPEASRAAATGAADRVLVGRSGWLRENAESTPAPAEVQRAVFTGHRLRFRYTSRGGQARLRTVDPLGLVESAGQWYLLALQDGEDRTYRVDRIEEAEELSEPAARPSGVDLDALWERRRADFRRRVPHVECRVRGDRALLARETMLVREEPDALVIAFGSLRHAEQVLWSLAPHVVALDPPELVQSLRTRATAVAEVYASVT